MHVRLLLVTPPAAPFHLAPPPPHPPCTRYHHPPLSGARNAQVFRTAKGKQLPVYVDYRNGGTRMLTILRRYRGADRVRLLPCCFAEGWRGAPGISRSAVSMPRNPSVAAVLPLAVGDAGCEWPVWTETRDTRRP